MIAKGQKISDRYEIIKNIGEGGMANVFLAFDTILERNVAIKVLRGDLSSDEKFVRRFQREALQASSLTHENIVEVYDVGEDNGEYYIVMEYVQGKHLKNLLKKRGKLTPLEVVDILLQVTDGLSVAHDSYIIHRDIKPQNIMILENGIVKLTDFGIAVALNSTQLTQTNSVMGSVHYLPPEQASGKGATLQSDIYSLGILMYELLTGKLPFRGDNAVEIALKHLKEPMPNIKDEIPDLPQSLVNIIMKATAKNPKNRYVDAREMHEDLKTCLDPSRKDEKKYTFAYPENEYMEGKSLKVQKQIEEANVKGEGEEVIAKKITESDLKKQNKGILTLLAIFTGIVVLITTIVVLLPFLNKSTQAIVPDVENKTVKEATKILQDAGFVVNDETVGKPSTEVEAGYVLETKPTAGAKRKTGSEITLYVSTGDANIKIDNYINRNYYEVKGILETQGVIVYIEKVDVEEEDGVTYKENYIIEQSIKAGSYVTKGDSITLKIPNISSKYPDFTLGAYSIKEILEFCSNNNLRCSFKVKTSNGTNSVSINNSNADDYNNYTIVSQTRAEGTPITANATLTIVIENADSTNNNDNPNLQTDDCEDGDWC